MRPSLPPSPGSALANVHHLGPALLFTVSWITDGRILLVIALGWVLLESVSALARGMVLKLSSFSFCAMAGAATSATFLGGALPLQFEALLLGDVVTPSLDNRFAFNTEPGITAAVGLYLTLFRWMCDVLARWDRPLWRRVFERLRMDLSHPPALASELPLSLVAGSLALFVLLGSGLVAINQTYTGSGMDTEMPIWLSLIQSLVPVIAMSAVMIALWFRPRPLPLVLAAWALGAVLLFSFASGRRAILFACLLAAATWFWLRPKAISPRLMTIGALIGIPAFLAISVLFQAARLAQGDLALVMERPTLFDALMSDSFETRLPVAAQQFWSDFAARAYSIGFFADVFERLGPEQTFGGELLVYGGLLRAIPSLLWPDKIRQLADYGAPELPVQRSLGLYETDQAMPMAMVGFADWWIFGALLTPVLVFALSAGFTAIALLTRHLVARVAVVATAVTLAWNAEFDFASAFVALRFALIAALSFALMDLPQLGRRQGVRPLVRPTQPPKR
jgi:hypothetical protein